MLVFLALYLWPLMLALFSSFTQWNGFTAMKFVGFGNYAELFQDPNFRQATLNTLYSAMWGAFVHVPVGVILALVLSRKPRGWRFVRSAYAAQHHIRRGPGAAVHIYLQARFGRHRLNPQGVRASRQPELAIVAQHGLHGGHPHVAVVRGGHHADHPGGASVGLAGDLRVRHRRGQQFQIDWHINLPLIKRIIGTGIIITVTSVFKTFDIIYMTTQGGPGNKTLNLAVMMVNNVTKQTKYGYSNAIGVILLLLGAVVMLINTSLFRMGKED